MKIFLGTFSFVGVLCLSLVATAQETMLQGQSLLQELRQGGYVILLRHTAGDKSQKDAANVIVADCNTQRNLSRDGRMAAREIGQGIDSLQIPIGKVLSSPYCRAMDTGRLAFGRPEVSEALIYVADNDGEKRKAALLLKPMLSQTPPSKTNIVLISHSTNIGATIGFVPEEGEAIIFKPSNDGKYQIVGRIRPQQWNTLVS
jgi:phosphohistidine phosphatase SixA